ncbi:MAG TPA: dTDP-4-amino-4,6-dideoxygalactose transaminase [Microscillaceae bacterium]|jgi:dTDP-4-amino-4,6-dideoxygalactose transaminase|nr:dTDP-4-amino-4,6-dideoxygalactose transaminase [Microscillaceae bacterium]
MIGFNKPYFTGKETDYMQDAVKRQKISGNGHYTQLCHQFFQKKYGFEHVLLTHSCTAALEMAALLINIQPGDEVIIPSYTFVSTANAFILRGAKVVFVDSCAENPNLDASSIAPLINARTKAIVVVHYAGIACHMGEILDLVKRHRLFLVEDAAQAIDSFWEGKPLGSLGHLACFSFHETKNIISGEGGMLVINDPAFTARAEILWEKGTNRSAFFRGEVDKYTWVDIGSSFLPSDMIAAFLYAQLENIDDIQQRRRAIWQRYFDQLQGLAEQNLVQLPHIPAYATNNAHMFYLVCQSASQRQSLIEYLKAQHIHAIFHYLSLHESPFYSVLHDGRNLPQTRRYTDCLVRLPFYYELSEPEQALVCEHISQFYLKNQVMAS